MHWQGISLCMSQLLVPMLCTEEVDLNVELAIPDTIDNDEACQGHLCSALAEEIWTFHEV